MDVSVVIPTHNRRDFLERAITSCFEGADDITVEVVVVDDASTDGTREWLEGLDDARVRARFQDHGGAQVARNQGIEAASGRYIKFLDDDDWLTPGALRREVRALDESGAELVGSDALVWRDGDVVDRYPAPEGPDPFRDLASGDATSHPLKFTMTRRLAESIRWDPDVEIRTDLEFMLRISLAAEGYRRVDDAAGYFRYHDGPRLSTPSREFEGATMHLALLCRTAETLLEEGTTPARAAALQVGLWRWLHLMDPKDPRAARRAWSLIRALETGRPFRPPRPERVLRHLDRLVGPMTVESIIRAPRRLKLWLDS